jgi:hypothetical protein
MLQAFLLVQTRITTLSHSKISKMQMEQKYNTCLSMPITKLMSKLVSTASLWVKGVITRGDSDLQNKKKEKKD